MGYPRYLRMPCQCRPARGEGCQGRGAREEVRKRVGRRVRKEGGEGARASTVEAHLSPVDVRDRGLDRGRVGVPRVIRAHAEGLEVGRLEGVSLRNLDIHLLAGGLVPDDEVPFNGSRPPGRRGLHAAVPVRLAHVLCHCARSLSVKRFVSLAQLVFSLRRFSLFLILVSLTWIEVSCRIFSRAGLEKKRRRRRRRREGEKKV